MRNSGSLRSPRLLLALALLAGLAAAIGGLRWATNSTPPTAPVAADPDGGGRERYMVTRGENEAEESANLERIEAIWNSRITYPTGRYDAAWLQAAAAQDRQMAEGVPAGRVSYSQAASHSPLSLDPTRFTALGPQPAQSNGCSGCFPYGHVSGRVNTIAIDPVQTNVAYLASVGGGVWRTTNCCTATTTWAPVTDDPLLANIAIDALAIDPNNHNTVYAGTGDLNFGSFSMGTTGILKSTDQGTTWTTVGADVFTPYYPQPGGQFPQYQAVGKVQVDPRSSNNIVAGTKTGVFFSYNGGTNWSGPCLPDAFPTQRQDVTGLLMSNNGTSTDLYVAVGARGYSTTVQYDLAENGANGIYKTTVPASGCPAAGAWSLISRSDNGWPVGTGTGVPVYQPNGDTLGRIDMAMAPSNPNYLYAIVQAINPTSNRGGVLGVWRTTDAGVTWAQRAGVGSGAAEWQGCDRTGTQSWYNQGIEVDPNNPDVLFADTIDIFKSTDGADTFTNVTCGYAGGTSVHVDQHALKYVPGSSSVMLTGSDGGIYVTLNADGNPPSFSQLNDSMNTIEFYSGDITANFANSNAPGINAGAQDNGSMVYQWSGTPGPAMWQVRNGGDGMFARIEPVLGLRWYQESQNGNLRVSTTGPFGPLSSATGGWTADSPRVSFVFPYEIYKYDCPATGCTHMIAGSYRVWETILGGIPTSSWQANSPDLTKNTLADRSFINQLSYAVSLSTTAIVGTNDGNVWYGFGLGQGVPNSATWVNVTGGNAVLPNRPILDVTTDPVNPLVGYAAVGGFDQNTSSTTDHVFQVTCTANCATFTWANKSGNLPNIPVDTILANPNFPQQVFAGSDWGLYFTNDITVGSPTWVKFTAGLPNVMIWDMAIDRGFSTLALFTRSRGAYAWPLPAGPIGGTPSPTPSPGPPSATPTNTPVVPTNTATNTPASATNTPVGATNTPVSATNTPVGATNTPASATNTPASATNTPVGATNTPQATSTPGEATATPIPCGITFTDVHPTDYFYEPVRYLYCQGVISGYADNTFRPYNNTTRGQMVKIVVLGFGIAIQTPATPTFSDVPPSHPFYQFIETAAANNIVSGYADGTFRPQNNVTRGQLSKIDVVAAGWTLLNPPASGRTFTDVVPNTAFYETVETAACHGIISGYTCGGVGEPCDDQSRAYFRQNNEATRGQISKIVYLSITNPSGSCPAAPAE